MTPRPQALAVEPDGIPVALKAERRWALWRYDQRPGSHRWVKIPHQVHERRWAKSNDPQTWSTFDDARSAYQSGKFDGLFFALLDG